MEDMKKNRAERIARTAFWIGVCIVPGWILLVWFTNWFPNWDSLPVWMFAPLIASLAGLVLGVIGLVLSIRKQSRTRKGIVLSSIGIGFCQLSLCVAALLRIAIYGLGHPWRM